jgi:hypothetical protein
MTIESDEDVPYMHERATVDAEASTSDFAAVAQVPCTFESVPNAVFAGILGGVFGAGMFKVLLPAQRSTSMASFSLRSVQTRGS